METKDKGQFVRYYDRSRRLERASPNALFAIARHNHKKPGFLRSLMATRSLAFLFFSILFMLVAVFVVDWVQRSRNQGTLEGNRFVVEAIWFDGHVYATVARGSVQPGAKPVATEIIISAGSDIQQGFMASADMEYRAKVAAETRPEWLALVLVSAQGRLELAALVK
jgi:hypothetical protein